MVLFDAQWSHTQPMAIPLSWPVSHRYDAKALGHLMLPGTTRGSRLTFLAPYLESVASPRVSGLFFFKWGIVFRNQDLAAKHVDLSYHIIASMLFRERETERQRSHTDNL